MIYPIRDFSEASIAIESKSFGLVEVHGLIAIHPFLPKEEYPRETFRGKEIPMMCALYDPQSKNLELVNSDNEKVKPYHDELKVLLERLPHFP